METRVGLGGKNSSVDLNVAVLEHGQTENKKKMENEYHVFSKRQKWFVIGLIGAAGLFSGLSSNIYFPALDAIAKDLHVGSSQVSLTITSYLIAQAITPLIWGSLSDTWGRRPIYIASFSVYIIANIALSFSPNFWVLFFFRSLQAAGSASTVSLGNGVIQDVSPLAERGAFVSFYQAIRNFSMAFGPVIGGLLSNFLGFRSIFMFLLALSSIVIVLIIIFLPETLRKIAGNGSIRLYGVYRSVYSLWTREPWYMHEADEGVVRERVSWRTLVEPLKLLTEMDIVLNLLFGGVVYANWSMVTSSTTELLKHDFGLSKLLIGLAYLPNGFGTIFGSYVIGKLMTRDYVDAAETYKFTHSLPSEYKLSPKDIPADFPIERARLRHLPWIATSFILFIGIYGFSLAAPALTARPGWILIPLLLQFLIAATSNAVFALNQTLVSDLCPGKGASSTVINNLVRCTLGAVGVSLIQKMISVMDPGVAFFVLALITLGCTPLAAMSWFWGMGWRAKRMEQTARTKEHKANLFKA